MHNFLPRKYRNRVFRPPVPTSAKGYKTGLHLDHSSNWKDHFCVPDLAIGMQINRTESSIVGTSAKRILIDANNASIFSFFRSKYKTGVNTLRQIYVRNLSITAQYQR